MEYLFTAAWTIFFTLLFLGLYKLVINPQIVLTVDASKMSKCPDGWTYEISTKSCQSNTPTSCSPFDPDAPTIQSAAAKCNLARTCGTTWSGMCG
jgi:hypothetical protein